MAIQLPGYYFFIKQLFVVKDEQHNFTPHFNNQNGK